VAFDFDLDDGGVPTYSVGELAEAINSAIRRRFTDGVWVRGEIQGWSERGPHAYFRLVEDTDDGKAAINIQFFANARMRLRPILAKHRLRLGDGLKVRIFGHLDYFAPSGQLGLKMSGLDPRFTLGEMALERDEVVRRLVASGLFDANRRTSVAAAPLRVGVVTSTASAAWGDFTHELDRSGLAFRVRVIDVRVQGEWAVDMVSGALRTLTSHDDLDVVVLIRGGGSKTELATFDHESIATAIATSPLPVFTGLGHEVDRSVADEVAHSSLKTPTACAAALVEHVYAFQAEVERVWSTIDRHANRALQQANASLTTIAHGLRRATVSAVERSDDRLGHRRQRLGAATYRALERSADRLASARASLGRVPARLEPELRHIDAVAARVRLLDPVHTMARGWSITRTGDGEIVRSADTLAAGATIITTFAKGSARSRVEETST
jgi:exodeoxyribonuclease VII large subunit